METKRYETQVEVDHKYFTMVHKAVIYVVRFNDNNDTETILMAANHRWREGHLMVIITNRDVSEKEAHKRLDYLLNSYIVCERCHRELDSFISFRIDIRRNRYKRVVCAYCDPTVYDMVLPYDYQEVARHACKHRHD
jgi:hypothetical protein